MLMSGYPCIGLELDKSGVDHGATTPIGQVWRLGLRSILETGGAD